MADLLAELPRRRAVPVYRKTLDRLIVLRGAGPRGFVTSERRLRAKSGRSPAVPRSKAKDADFCDLCFGCFTRPDRGLAHDLSHLVSPQVAASAALACERRNETICGATSVREATRSKSAARTA